MIRSRYILAGMIFLLAFGFIFFGLNNKSSAQTTERELIRPAGSDGFGTRMDSSGNTVVVGSIRDDVNGIDRAGRVYVYEKDASGNLNNTQILQASDPSEAALFGLNVSISGDRIVVGAAGSQEKVYIFERISGVWEEVEILRASDGVVGDNFGSCVSVSENTILAGANFADVGAEDKAGKAYIFERDSNGVWNETLLPRSLNPKEGDFAGFTCALSGDYAVVGVPGWKDLRGYAIVYERDVLREWNEVRRLIRPGGENFDQFAFDLDLEGGIAIIGAPNAYKDPGDITGIIGRGAVFIFERRSGDGKWLRSELIAGEDFGSFYGDSVAISSDKVIIGAYGSSNENGSTGKIYKFNRVSFKNWTQSDVFAPSIASTRFLGDEVSISGDLYLTKGRTSSQGNSSAAFVFESEPVVNGMVLMDLIPLPTAGLVTNMTVKGATESSEVVFIRGTRTGTFSDDRICPGLEAGIRNYKIVNTEQSDSAGTASTDNRLPRGWPDGFVFYVQAVDVSTCKASNVVMGTVVPPKDPTFVLNSLSPLPIGGLASDLNSNGSTGSSEIVFIRGSRAGVFSDDRICAGLQTGIRNYKIIDTADSDLIGNASYSYQIPRGLADSEHHFQAIDTANCSASNVVTESILSLPEGDLVFSGYEQVGASTYEYTIDNVTPGRQVAVFKGDLGTDSNEICEDVDLDILVDSVEPTLTADDFGVAKGQVVVSGFPGGFPLFYFQALDVETCRKSNVEDYGIDE